MAYPSITQRLLETVEASPSPRAQLYRAGGRWEAVSSQEMMRRIAGLSRALAELGIKSGDSVGLFAPNCPEWHIADFAVLGLGAVDVPIYFNEAPDRMVFILNHAEVKAVIAIGEVQVRRLIECRSRLTTAEHYIVAAGPPEVDGDVLRYETLIAGAGSKEVEEYRRRALLVTSDHLATIIYTSGTTGEPKGVMLSHANISSNEIDSSRPGENYTPDDVALTFLPLAHIYERMVDYGFLSRSIPLAYLEHPEDVQKALVEVRPTIMAAVPRVFEKAYANIQQKRLRLKGWRRKLFDWAMDTARAAVPWRCYGRPVALGVKLNWALANAIAYPKIRAGLGGRLRGCFSGSAPLQVELLEFFWTAGVPIYQGYGLTETSPVVSTNWRGPNKIGTVGLPIANVEVRIAADGEILVRGPCVMQGYFKKPDATREVLTPDGWLYTGDIGYLDEDGYLVITDRKKDLIKTAAGKFVAPQPIENKLKTSPYILNAAVIGDRRKFVIALVVPNFPAVEAKAAEMGLTFSSPAELAAHPWVRELIEGEVEQLTSHMAQYEKVKRFALLDRDFTFDGGELTYTLKLRRRLVEQRYRDAIENLYADVEEPRPIAQ
jgi:long-chain acyl-CoA synthetase